MTPSPGTQVRSRRARLLPARRGQSGRLHPPPGLGGLHDRPALAATARLLGAEAGRSTRSSVGTTGAGVAATNQQRIIGLRVTPACRGTHTPKRGRNHSPAVGGVESQVPIDDTRLAGAATGASAATSSGFPSPDPTVARHPAIVALSTGLTRCKSPVRSPGSCSAPRPPLCVTEGLRPQCRDVASPPASRRA